MEDIAWRQQQLRQLQELMIPLELVMKENAFLKPLVYEKYLSMKKTVDVAFSLYDMFERKCQWASLGYFPTKSYFTSCPSLAQNRFVPQEVTRRVCVRWKRFTEDASLWRDICEAHKFSQPLTRQIAWEWVFRSKQSRLSLFNGAYVGRKDSDEGTYEGEFRDGKREGFGIFAGTTRYEGEWKNDKCHGIGECRFPNGAIYMGDYVEGVQHGSGTKTWANGSTYQGLWANGFQNGYGVLQWQDGERYEGMWEQGSQSGHGKYTWPDGDVYDGEWKRDTLHGRGRHMWHDGCAFDGDWRDGKRVGKGEYRWPDGSSYEGEFEDSKRHGSGTMRWADGSVWTGRWHDDTPMDQAMQSRAWDGFFHKNYEQQRAYVRELMQNSKDPHRQISSPS